MSLAAGLVGSEGEDVVPLLLSSIAAASSSIPDFYGLATPSNAEYYPSLPLFPGVTGSSALAYRFVRIEPTDNPQPLHQANQAISLLGRFADNERSALTLADYALCGGRDGLKKILIERRGPYSAILSEDGRLLCCRDVLGVVPLYYGISDNLACVASNKKMVSFLGLEPKIIEPGRVAELEPGSYTETEVTRLERPGEASLSIDEAADGLSVRLQTAADRAVGANPYLVIAFSGGIDSTLLAFYLRKTGARPLLSCVAAEGSKDSEAAETSADALGLPLRVRTIKEGDVEEALDAVLSSVEDANPIKVGVALPLYFVAKGAVSEGRRLVVSGNMSDELFGGYARYADTYAREGESAVRGAMFRDVERSHEANFERDWKVCTDLGAELRVPFADSELVNYALSLSLSVIMPEGGPRKAVIRKLASKLGLPNEVVERPKSAAQYSSGSQKILEKLARKAGMTLSSYLSRRMEALRVGKPI